MTKIYDLFVVPQNYDKATINEFINIAQKLELAGLCFCFEAKDLNEARNIKKILQSIKAEKKPKIKILFGVIICPDAKNKLYQKINLYREIADLLIAKAINANMQRAICESKKIDLLIRNYATGSLFSNQGYFDDIMTNLCKKNNIANTIIFSDLMEFYKTNRANYLKFVKADLKLFKKYNAPIVVASGAKSPSQLKDKYSLLSVVKIFEKNEEFRELVGKNHQNLQLKIKF